MMLVRRRGREIRQRVREATAIIRGQLANRYARKQSRPPLQDERIKQEVEDYCRDQDGLWPVGLPSTRSGRPTMVPVRLSKARAEIEQQKRAAKQAEQALRDFRDTFFEEVEDKGPSLLPRDEDTGPRLRWRPRPEMQSLLPDPYNRIAPIDLKNWILVASVFQKTPKAGWPKDADMPARYHAALIAVRLFQMHGLKCKASRSRTNGLVRLAKVISDKPYAEGWSDVLRAAINASSSN